MLFLQQAKGVKVSRLKKYRKKRKYKKRKTKEYKRRNEEKCRCVENQNSFIGSDAVNKISSLVLCVRKEEELNM